LTKVRVCFSLCECKRAVAALILRVLVRPSLWGLHMAKVIHGIFLDPPIAIARLGGSEVPQPAYTWVQPLSPRTEDSGQTVVMPQWSLNVLPNGSVEPFLPSAMQFRDGALIRPVCPFFELWALVGAPNAAPDVWKEEPVTPELLRQFGATLSDLTFRVDAHNAKAARRARNPALRFGTNPALEVRGDDYQKNELRGKSPAGSLPKMVPPPHFIPLGFFQVLRSIPSPPADPPLAWVTQGVRVDVVRVRFTPGKGFMYGPPTASQQLPAFGVSAVDPSRAFLSRERGLWSGVKPDAIVIPEDTYDGEDIGRSNALNPSLGIVDDTCDARIEAVLTIPGARQPLRTHASVLVGPPDFAPDRRPFLSAADEINDRARGHRSLPDRLSSEETEAWVQDLFGRIFETLSLLNVDFHRRQRARDPLSKSRLGPPILDDDVAPEEAAMGSRDLLRNQRYAVAAPNVKTEPLPLTQYAKSRHRNFADINALRTFITQHKDPNRLLQLIRGAFEVERMEDGDNTSMRMPPFMRHSNAFPLTLSAWQYKLLMSWVQSVIREDALGTKAKAPIVAKTLSDEAQDRREVVLTRMKAGAPK
jgi:hypothetical protein